MKTGDHRAELFLISILLITLFATQQVASALIVTDESLVLSVLWISGFAFLFANVAYLIVISILHLLLKKNYLPETYVKEFPKVAIVYPVRNETVGLYERINYSLSGNLLPCFDLWILSDSNASHEPYEMELVQKLKDKYGARVSYRRRVNPTERKQGNLHDFLQAHPEYTFLYITDADGMIPRGAVLKLLRKALHPKNQDIAIFQSFVKIAHARTWYARFEKLGTESSQRINFTTIQQLMGRSISFGHHQLVRRKALSEITLPKGLLSHDNWDTVLLDQLGHRVAFCPDVVGFDEAPANYLEAMKRSARWAQGTLQGFPLPFMRGVTLASRFLAFYGIYLYLADVVFFFWVMLGLLSHSALTGELIHFEVNCAWLGGFANETLRNILILSLAVIYFHKLVLVRSMKDFKHFFFETAFSTLVTLNNFLYVPLHMMAIPFKKLTWRPMKKNPFENLCFKDAVKNLLPGTVLGVMALYFLTHEMPYFVWQVTPLIVSLVLSIPLVYFTSKPVPSGIIKFI